MARRNSWYHRANQRGWSDASSRLVGFEQLLYLRQPGYGPSYIVGKLDLDHLLALAAHRADLDRKPFDNRAAFAAIFASGIVPPAIIEDEMETASEELEFVDLSEPDLDLGEANARH